jgi:hypothetical protein
VEDHCLAWSVVFTTEREFRTEDPGCKRFLKSEVSGLGVKI